MAMTDREEAAARENIAFTEKAIRRAQSLSIEDRFCQALTEYLARMGRLYWDNDLALFWVAPPHGKPEVAVWMMPVANRFEPRADRKDRDD